MVFKEMMRSKGNFAISVTFERGMGATFPQKNCDVNWKMNKNENRNSPTLEASTIRTYIHTSALT